MCLDGGGAVCLDGGGAVCQPCPVWDARRAAGFGLAAGLALGVAAGTALGLRLGRPAPDAPIAQPTAAGSSVPGRGEPAEHPATLQELEAEAEWWRLAYEELARSLDGALPGAQVAAPAAPEEGAAGGAASAAAEQAANAAAEQAAVAGAGFDAAALLARGYTEQEVDRLRERFEAYELELLYLGDQARREGWQGRGRHKIAAKMLQDGLRAELGERDYDAALYASGRNNRVRVAGVLAGSAAERAGLRDGDELISYDGRRIFDAQSVVRATGEGEPGSTTELRVRRGDEELRVELPRGPIGIRLEAVRREPEGFP